MAVYKIIAREVDPATVGTGTSSTPDLLGKSITGSPKVTINSWIRYIVKLYENDGSTALTSGSVNISWDAKPGTPKNVTWRNYFTKSGGTFGLNTNTNWWSDIIGSGASTIKPVFTITVDGTPATLSGSIPTPIFTIAPVSKLPALPTAINTDLKAAGVVSNGADAYFSPCTGAVSDVWAVHIIKETAVGILDTKYKNEIRFYKKDGSAGKPTLQFGIDPFLRDNNSTTTAYSKARKYLIDFRSGLLCASATKATANPGGTDPKSKTYTGPRWNPPNHINTRGDSHGERITGGMQSKDLRLGYIYSDNNYKSNTFMSSTAQNPNSANAEWGFRFHYNPAEISYSTQAMLQTDVQLMSKDPTQMVPGNTSITLGLVLNRQLDMSLLDKDNPERARWSNYYPKDPVRGSLTEDQLHNFWTRGTEYDLEFFYRIVTGFEPSSRSLLKNGDLTSDLGFLTVQPFWITFHDNMTYFCKMTGIDVTHRAFTKDMVPYLTEVTLSMTRMVTPELDITKTKNKVISSSHVSSWKGNTGPAATGGIGP